MNEVDDIDLDNPFPEPFEVEITDSIDLHAFHPREIKSVVENYLSEAWKKGFRVVRINRVVAADPQNSTQWNRVVRIKPVINAGGNLGTVTRKRLRLPQSPLPNFRITVGKTAPRNPKGQVGPLAQQLRQADFGIDVDRRDRQAQSDVRAEEIRIVAVIKCVAGDGPFSLDGLVVADLDELSLLRINLANGAVEQGEKKNPCPENIFTHRQVLQKNDSPGQADLF